MLYRITQWLCKYFYELWQKLSQFRTVQVNCLLTGPNTFDETEIHVDRIYDTSLAARSNYPIIFEQERNLPIRRYSHRFVLTRKIVRTSFHIMCLCTSYLRDRIKTVYQIGYSKIGHDEIFTTFSMVNSDVSTKCEAQRVYILAERCLRTHDK